jgi:hypothetical protein
MLFQLYGLSVDTDFPFSDVPPSIPGHTDIKIRFLRSQKTFPKPSDWFMQWHLPGGELWLSFAKLRKGYLLHFEDLSDFFVYKSGKEIVYLPKSGISSDTIRHLLLNQVIPLVINLRGREALHASAVLAPHGIIAFSGPTGSGKSTIAGSLLKVGYPLMSDDCLALTERDGKIHGMAAYPGLRLWGDSFKWLFGNGRPHKPVAHYTDKQQVHITTKEQAIPAKSQTLKRLYAIVDPSEIDGKKKIVIEPLAPRESFMALVRCAFRLDISDNNMLKAQFHFLRRVVSTVPVRRLIFPRDFKLLPALQEAILNDLTYGDNELP